MKDNQTIARLSFYHQGNEIYCEYSTGFWTKREYDNQGNQIYFEDSDGFIIDKRPKPITELEKQVEAMRDAIKEVEKLLFSINLNDIFEDTMRNHAKLALTKLKPFLNP